MKKTLLFTLALLCIMVSRAQEVLVYASDRANDAVNVYDQDGNFLDVFIESGAGGLSNPQDLIFHPDGSILISGFNNTQILQYDGTTGEFLGPFSNGYDIQGATRMEIHNGLIYVLQWNSNYQVLRFEMNGDFLDEFSNIGVYQAIGITWDEEDNMYVASYGGGANGSVQLFDQEGNLQGFFGSTNYTLAGPTNIWFGPWGFLWACDYSQNRIVRFTEEGDFIDEIVSQIPNPEGVAYLPNGDLLVAERGGDRISRFGVEGEPLGRWDNGGTLSEPNFVRVQEPSLGIDELAIENRIFVNTIGRQFQIAANQLAHIGSVSIFDTSGRMVRSFTSMDSGIIQVLDLQNGLYISQVQMKDGSMHSVRLLVR